MLCTAVQYSRVYCENFVMIGLTADAGDHVKNRAQYPSHPHIQIYMNLCFGG
jgi:hypothetical protein